MRSLPRGTALAKGKDRCWSHLSPPALFTIPALALVLGACEAPPAQLPAGEFGTSAPVSIEAVRADPGGARSGAVAAPEAAAGWFLDEVVYSGAFLDLSRETANTRSVDFHPDGTLLFVVGRDTENVVTYQLSTPWDVTAGAATDSLDLSSDLGAWEHPESVAHGLYIRKDDGGMMWIWNRTEILEYTLDVPWRVSSARPTAHRSFAGTVLRGHDIDFRPDGLKLYVDDRNSQAVFQFALEEAWDVTTATLEYTLDISDQEEAVRGIEFKPDGSRMFLMDTARRDILEYHLDMPWEIETARFVQALSVGGQHDDPRGITWRTDGRRFYVTQASGLPALHQYDLVTR